MVTIPNPWLSIKPTDAIKMADGDKAILQSFVSNNVSALKDWPEPYMGNPNASVYFLNGNPYLGDTPNAPLYDNLMQHNLMHQSVNCYNPFVFFNDIIVNGKLLGGCEWWQKRTKKLQEELGHLPNIFVVEYFPYRTDVAKDIPNQKILANTPSYKYANQLIYEAMNAGKLIVIMRMANLWLQRIPQLTTYPNMLRLINSQNISITEGNVYEKGCSAWHRLTGMLKKYP